jgi:predicted transcriptional regulator
MLAKLVAKGHVTHEYDGPRYIYRPSVPRESAQEPALDRVVDTFFGGSAARTIAALLDQRSTEMDEVELDRLGALIEEMKGRGR